MMIHASIPADHPERVARVIADLWRGRYAPFPVAPGVYVAMSGDDRGTQIEVGPRGRVAKPGAKQLEIFDSPSPSPYSEVHLNIISPLSEHEIMAIAEREGWTALACDRGGFFKLIEFWVENKFMLELMNEHEWARYKIVTSKMAAALSGRARPD